MRPELEGFGLILSHGPPFSGKEKFIRDHLSQTHTIINPKQLYRENSRFGIRDVALVAYKKLKEGHKVVILDTNECRKTRESYVKLLKKKFEDLRVAIVSCLPRHGCRQLFWSRELRFARPSLEQHNIPRPCHDDDDDENILLWFDKSSDTAVVYKHTKVDAVKDSEAETVYQEEQGIVVKSTYKFEVAALFVQWESLGSVQDEGSGEKSLSGLVEALNNWSLAAPCGRIIVVCDGMQIRTGERSRSQQASDIEEVLKKITHEFAAMPVYVYHIEKPSEAGSFVLPPNPGILAYLQGRHHLNLISKHTVYMYESSLHMKMAENAGVRHVKASRIISHPSLITSSHAATIPRIPAMLQQLTVQQEEGGTAGAGSQAKVPLYSQALQQTGDKPAHAHLGHGRAEFMFVQDLDILERYQTLYASKARRVDEPGSVLSPVMTVKVQKRRSSLDEADTSSCQDRTSLGPRDLPRWMLPREESTASNASLKSSLSSSSSLTEKKVRKSVYVMSEKELIEVATEVLKQAGRTDILNKMQDEGNIPHADTASKTSTPKPHKSKAKHRRDTPPPSVQPSLVTDISETLSSICPKLEVDDWDKEESQAADIAKTSRKQTKAATIDAKRRERKPDRSVKGESVIVKQEAEELIDVDDNDLDGCKVTGDTRGGLVSRPGDELDLTGARVGRKPNVRRVTKDRSGRSKEITSSVLDDFMDIVPHRKPSPKKKTDHLLKSRELLSDSPSPPKRPLISDDEDSDCSRPAKVNKKHTRQTPDLSILDDIFL